MEHEQAIQGEIEDLLRQKIGLNPNSVDARFMVKAVKKGMRMSKVQTLSDYVEGLKTSPALLEALVESVVVLETRFFRNRAAFAFLRHWIAQEQPQLGRKLRVLSVPCSTGEEPCSIAITLLEEGLSFDDFQIDAVDISAIAIAKAKEGIYSPYAFRRQAYRQDDKYFVLGLPEGTTTKRSAQRYLLAEPVYQKISFIQANILDPALLANAEPYDIIFCRNLLMYFDQDARDRTITNLSQRLRTGGLLFVGSTECELVDQTLYKAVPYPKTFAYRKHDLKVIARK